MLQHTNLSQPKNRPKSSPDGRTHLLSVAGVSDTIILEFRCNDVISLYVEHEKKIYEKHKVQKDVYTYVHYFSIYRAARASLESPRHVQASKVDCRLVRDWNFD